MDVRELYLIGATREGPLKIGIAKDADKRCRELQTGNPDRLRVLWRIGIWTFAAEFAEDLVHRMLSEHRIGGEWFDVPIETAMGAIWTLQAARWGLSTVRTMDGSPEVILTSLTLRGIDCWRKFFERERARGHTAHIPVLPGSARDGGSDGGE